MGHSVVNMKNKKILGIGVVLLVSALIAVYVFKVSWRTLAPFALLAFFVVMHLGGGHGGHGDDAPRDAGHTPAPADETNARTPAPAAAVRPLASGESAETVEHKASHRHDGDKRQDA